MKYALPLLAFLLLPEITLPAADPTPKIPQTVPELWADFAELDKSPLETEVLKEWEQDGVVCRIVRYQVGVFKGAPARVAAFYAFPKGGTKLPALLELHGGGQSASLNSVVTYAKRGYASISLNWGGNKMSLGGETWSGVQTDWGKLDATHPPQRNKTNHFVGALTPDEYTLDAVESPRNSNWYLVLLAARRAITLLQQQPEVDPARIGVHGHSMGANLRRILRVLIHGSKPRSPRAAVRETCSKVKPTSPAAAAQNERRWSWPACPTTRTSRGSSVRSSGFRQRTTLTGILTTWRGIGVTCRRSSPFQHLAALESSPHGRTCARRVFVLRGAPPGRPPEAAANPTDRVGSQNHERHPARHGHAGRFSPIQRVDIYYSLDPHALTRFWRDAQATKNDKHGRPSVL